MSVSINPAANSSIQTGPVKADRHPLQLIMRDNEQSTALRFCSFLIILVSLISGCSNGFQYHWQHPDTTGRECVVLVHGLRANSSFMHKLQDMLVDSGYHVLNLDYPSSKYKIQALADTAIGVALEECKSECDTVHFIGHSMGNALIRYTLQKPHPCRVHRIVMIAPVNQGSELVSRLNWVPLFAKLNSPAGMQLGSRKDSFVNSLPPLEHETGIIAGSRSINPVASLIIPGKDDGRVSIENTKEKGMNDFIIVPANHHVITKKDSTINCAVRFIQHGHF
ncbi:MAG: alpha/beta hydrolase [candidate division KSB1 bacterium]|nr:alpha/beta hydrolase [candidate division KSB1 bacterium]